MTRKTKESGFTFIELVFIVWLIGLMLSLAVPAFYQLGESVRGRMLMQQLAQELQTAQLDAISRESPVQVSWDKQEVRTDQGQQRLRSLLIPSDYQIRSNYRQNQLTFQSTGQVRGGTLTIWKQGKRIGSLVIQVASGRIRIQFEASEASP